MVAVWPGGDQNGVLPVDMRIELAAAMLRAVMGEPPAPTTSEPVAGDARHVPPFGVDSLPLTENSASRMVQLLLIAAAQPTSFAAGEHRPRFVEIVPPGVQTVAAPERYSSARVLTFSGESGRSQGPIP